MTAEQTEVTITEFQRRVLELPAEVNIAALGGRGGGKTFMMTLLALRFAEQYKERARALLVRKSYIGLRDVEESTRSLFFSAYQENAKYSQTEHLWKLPGRATFELAQLEAHSDLQKFQGRSFGLIMVDECGQYPSMDLPMTLRANLRGPKGLPVRQVLAANPGSVGQSALYSNFIRGRTPWKPFQNENGDWWCWCPSVMSDNPHLDPRYEQQLRSACAHDPELLKAWLEGSFVSATGAYFGAVLDVKRNACGPFPPTVPRDEDGKLWRTWISVDHGSAAPCIALLLAESPGGQIDGQYFSRGSIVVLDECAFHRRDNLNVGTNQTAAAMADRIIDELCKRWGVPARGVIDDASFARHGHATCIADEYSLAGLVLGPAKKGDRVSGWTRMKRLLADAGRPDRPGLYISRSCAYTWETLPFAARDPRRPEDLDSSGADHACDCLRYGLNYSQPATVINLKLAM